MTESHTKQKITIFDVAHEAGVSKSTVSLVLTDSDKTSDKTKLKVLAAIDKLGYVYNRDAASLRSKRSKIVGVLINDLTNPYSAQLAVGLERHLHQLGMLPMLINSDENYQRQKDTVRTLREYNVAAIIMCPAPGTETSWVDQLISSGLPVINIMREVPYSNAPSVLPDNQKGSHQATNHLINQGLTSIAFLGGTEDISDFHERLEGFHRAIKHANIDINQCPVIQAPTNRQGGREAMKSLLEQYPQLQGVVCFSDVIAYGAIESLKASHISVGDQIKIVGFDDLADSSLMSPALTTVRIDADEIGKRTCQVLSEILQGTQPPVRTLVDVNLKIRASG